MSFMKPCFRKRKAIVLLALHHLDARPAVALRAHLAQCAGCGHYWMEISKLNAALGAAPESDFEPTAAFHRGVAAKLRHAESHSLFEIFPALLGPAGLGWRLLLSAGVALILGVGGLALLRSRPTDSLVGGIVVPSGTPNQPFVDANSSVAGYQRLAHQCLDCLDALLVQQGNQPLPPVPAYAGVWQGECF